MAAVWQSGLMAAVWQSGLMAAVWQSGLMAAVCAKTTSTKSLCPCLVKIA